jgi:outer membrane protein insertion porin family
MNPVLMSNHGLMDNFKRVLVCCVVFFFCHLAPGLCLAAGEPPVKKILENKIGRIDIQILGVKGDTHLWESIARDLIQLKPSDVYGPDRMAQAIERLEASNIFFSIHVPDPVKTAQGVDIRIELVPYGRIKDIQVYNAFPMFEREVLNVMTLYTGDAFIAQTLEDQSERVITLFKKQGYIDPKVTLSARQDETDGNYELSVRIDKGDFLRVNRVEIRGNTHFSSSRLKLRIKTWKASVLFGSAGRFIQKELDADVKNILAFYRKKGFADVNVSAEVINRFAEKQVDVIFHVEEGSRYEVVFEGNDAFWDCTLKQEMTLSKEGNKNNFALRKSVRKLKQKYTEQGYPDVKITPAVKQTDSSSPSQKQNEIKQVTLAIDEGDQYRVSTIKITGNHSISDKEISKSMLTRESGGWKSGIYVSKILDQDINAVRALYLKEGYTQTRVDRQVTVTPAPDSGGENRQQVDILLTIDEGVLTRVDQVQFKGLSVLSSEAALELIALRPGQPYRGYMIENDETRLRQKISESGYPSSKVTPEIAFSADRSRASLTYTIEQGPYMQIGQISYVGNFRTRESILANEMEVSPGDPVSLVKILESRRNMMDVYALDSVRFRTIGLKTSAEEVDIIVEVEEKKPYFFEMGIGYDTERHFYLNSKVGDHNFLGQNLDLQVGGEISQIGYKGEISVLEPRFFYSRILSSTRVFGEQQEEFNKDFGVRSFGVSQNFSRQFFSKKVILNLGIMYEFREQSPTLTQPVTQAESEQYESRHIIVASPGIVYNTTDSYVRPRKGTLTSFNMDFSNGIDNDLDDFIKYRLDTRYYYTLFDPLVLALRGRYRIVEPYGSNTDVPEDQLFFLGGTSSVRGFDENLLRYDAAGNAVGGRESILGTFEARYDLGLNFEFSAFYDIGAVRKTQSKAASEAFRDSVGIGFRYMTPIGPIGLLYGWKLDPLPNESTGSFHFSMGYTF